MPPPTWVVGQVLTAADVNSWFVPVVAYATADQSVTSSTTLVNSTYLSVPVAAGANYILDMYLYFTGGTSGASDLKWAWTYPSGLIMRYAQNTVNIAGNYQAYATSIESDTVITQTGGAGYQSAGHPHGTIRNPTNAGTLQFRFAQNTSSGTATVIKTDSCIKLTRVS